MDRRSKLIRKINVALVAALALSVPALAAGQVTLKQIVNQAKSSVEVSVANPIVSAGQPLTLTAEVRGAQSLIPTGTIQFDASAVGSQSTFSSPALVIPPNGRVQWSTTLPTSEQYSIVAAYAGDQNFASSGSFPPLIVGPKPSAGLADFTLDGPNTLTVHTGQPASATLTVQPVNGFTGSVSLSCHASSIYVGCLVSPKALSFVASSANDSQASQSLSVSILTKAIAIGGGSVGLFLGVLAFGYRRRRSAGLASMGLLATLILVTGCLVWDPRQNTPIGLYQVTVSAASGTASHTKIIAVNVTQ